MEKGINLVEKYDLKEAADIANRVLCLPLYPKLEIATVDNIISTIERFVR